MSTSLKDTSPVLPTKGTAAQASTPNVGGSYMPSGMMLAMICKALRDAQTADLEIQQDQAETEQKYYQALGGIGQPGGIGKGLISMAAQSVIDAGSAEADGLVAQGIANAVNAGVSGITTIGVGIQGVKGWRESGKLDDEADNLNAFGEKLKNSPDGDMAIGAQGKPVDPDVDAAIQQRVPKQLEADPAKYNAARMEAKGQLKEENENALKEVRRKQGEISNTTQSAFSLNQAVTNVSQATTGAVSSYQQAAAKTEAAAHNADAQVQKQVQDMNSSSANTFKDQAKQAAQAALQASDTIAQVGQAQVQFRG